MQAQPAHVPQPAPEETGADARVSSSRWPRRRRRLVEFGGAGAVTLILAFVLLRLWRADLRVPFDYHDDALYFEMIVKSVVDHGWFLTNPSLGAPGTLSMHDFPSADGVHLLAIRLMAAGGASWALLYNLYFLLGFPLITMSALAVFRHFRVAYAPALVGSLLYAFLPSRLFMGEGHYFLSAFYEVPLAILVALWVAGDDPPLGWRRDRARTLAAVGVCALTAGTGIYYAFFAGVLITLAGIWGALRRRAARNALAALMLTGVIVLGLGVQAAPIVLNDARHGSNGEVAARTPDEAEVFGMRIAQLLLPVPGHRIPALRRLKRRYDAGAPFPGESSSTSLGVVGGLGFLVLLGALLRPAASDDPRRPLWRALAGLNLIALLVATTGGFGSLFALLVTPEIRTYARMHVFIGFLGLFAAVLLLDRLTRRSARIGVAVSGLVLAIGIFDQATPAAVRAYRDVKTFYDRDAALVHALEATVPPGAMIFELPYQPFPEGKTPPGNAPVPYVPLRPYLHSRSLRWSFPTMRGRPADAWVARVSALPPADLVRAVSDAGFEGILVNRHGYLDEGAKIEAALAETLGADVARKNSFSLTFFSLADYNRQAQAAVPPAERARRRELAAHPLALQWSGGFYPLEVGRHGTFRWCAGSGAIEIDNDSPFERQATLTFRVLAGKPPVMLTLGGDLITETTTVARGGWSIERTLRLAPGRHFIRMTGQGTPLDEPHDPRRLMWVVENPRLEELTPAAP